jgi:hypothetical protein
MWVAIRGVRNVWQGMGFRHEISDLEVRTGSSQPMLEVAEETHRQLS